MSDPTCAAVILAAGSSRRLGGLAKQLLRANGVSLVANTTRAAIAAGFSPILVVLGHQAESVSAELRALPVRTVLNENWADGMASSLKSGINSLLASAEPPANIAILVCDQPLLDAAHLKNLLRTHLHSNAPLTASHYDDVSGVPAIFSSPLFPELLQLTGDHGARPVIARHAADLASVPFPGGSFDVDSPSDVQRLKQ